MRRFTRSANGWLLMVAAPVAFAGEPPTTQPEQSIRMEIEFTPQLARETAKRYCKPLATRYEMSPAQTERVEAALAAALIESAPRNKGAVQALFEATLMATLTQQGHWSASIHEQFGRAVRDDLPALRETIARLAGVIRQELTVAQSVRFTADFALFSAGLARFEKRVERWAQGRVGDNDGLFWESPGDTGPTTRPDGKVESQIEYRARRQAEYLIEWNIDRVDREWSETIEEHAKLYQFTPAQRAAAEAIARDCRDRLKPLRTPELLHKVRVFAHR